MNASLIKILTLCSLLATAGISKAQLVSPKLNDSNTPLHELKPDYVVPYGPPSAAAIKAVLTRVYNYLDEVTPVALVNRNSQEAITDFTRIDSNSIIKPGDFRLGSYEWGVVYMGMLLAGNVTGEEKFTDYTVKRLQFISGIQPYFKTQLQKFPKASNALRYVLEPHALDDAGALCASMIKAQRTKEIFNLRPIIDNYASYISTKEFRLKDGTLARNRPLPNTLWLDDMFMSVPALAQMGALTKDNKYFDDAARQITQFSNKMFVKEKGLYMHGWVEDMTEHPAFHWARANGWAILAKVELLDVLPAGHPDRARILELLKAHCKGLAAYQSGFGFWHQLLDRPDSYLETSATAIYTYCIAHAINKGWLDAKTYGPMAILGWNAVSTKVNEKGQVEGTCVGTGMAFDPAFYYYRPVNVFAAHGYGPVLLAGAEMITLLKNNSFAINDSAVQLK